LDHGTNVRPPECLQGILSEDRIGEDLPNHRIRNLLSVHPVGARFHRSADLFHSRVARRIGLIEQRFDSLQFLGVFRDLNAILLSRTAERRLPTLIPINPLNSEKKLGKIRPVISSYLHTRSSARDTAENWPVPRRFYCRLIRRET
jgi:hypothetical protein